MDWQNIRRIVKFDYLILIPIMALAFYVAFIPHLNYPYPVHIDEWVHLACSEEIIKEGAAVGLSSPFTGGAPEMNQIYEVGFHLFWTVFQQLSGIPWLTIFRYFPSVIFIITVLSVYILAQRQGFGWEAALITCLIPTTVGVLGPAFMVPVAMGLLFIPLSLFIAFNFKTLWSYLVFFIFIAFLVTLHAWTAIGLVIILIPYILLNLKTDWKHRLKLTAIIVIPFLISLTWAARMALPMMEALFGPAYPQPFVDYPRLIETYGYLPIILCLLGTFFLAFKRDVKNYGIVLGMMALLVMLATFFTLHRGSEGLYARGLVITMFVMSIVAGAGLMWVKNIKLPDRMFSRLELPRLMRNAGYVLCPIIIGLMLFTSIPVLQNSLYYHMIDDEDYAAFVWIKENVNGSYARAILDPWKGTAFTAITGKYIYTRIHCYPQSPDEKASAFLGDNCSDTSFLRENGISIVYTTGECNNPDLMEVRKNVYLLGEER